jgi:hypothetical protein
VSDDDEDDNEGNDNGSLVEISDESDDFITPPPRPTYISSIIVSNVQQETPCESTSVV